MEKIKKVLKIISILISCALILSVSAYAINLSDDILRKPLSLLTYYNVIIGKIIDNQDLLNSSYLQSQVHSTPKSIQVTTVISFPQGAKITRSL